MPSPEQARRRLGLKKQAAKSKQRKPRRTARERRSLPPHMTPQRSRSAAAAGSLTRLERAVADVPARVEGELGQPREQRKPKVEVGVGVGEGGCALARAADGLRGLRRLGRLLLRRGCGVGVGAGGGGRRGRGSVPLPAHRREPERPPRAQDLREYQEYLSGQGSYRIPRTRGVREVFEVPESPLGELEGAEAEEGDGVEGHIRAAVLGAISREFGGVFRGLPAWG